MNISSLGSLIKFAKAGKLVAQDDLAKVTGNFANYINTTPVIKNLDVGVVSDGTALATGSTRLLHLPMYTTGVIKAISVFTKVVGTLKIKRFAKVENTDSFKFLSEISVNLNTLGLQTYNCYLPINEGEYIGLYSADAQITMGSAVSRIYYNGTGDIVADSTLTAITSTNQLYIKFTVAAQSILSPVLLTTKFDALPNKFTNNGFTVNNGLVSPATGSVNTTAYWNVYTTLDKHKLIARVKISDINSIFALIKYHTLFGAVGKIDCANKKLRLYRPWTGGDLPAEVANANISFDIVANREYTVSFEKNGSIHSLSITDTITNATSTVIYDNCKNPYSNCAGKAWGSPGIMFLQGNIVVTSLNFISTTFSPYVVIMGDSITEGYGLENIPNVSYEDRWAAKIRTALNGNCVISGRGGGDSADLLSRMDFDLKQFRPKYVVVLIGTNDNDLAAWKTNMSGIIYNILSIGATPILCVPPSGTLKTQQAAYLRTLPYTVVNFDYAMTLNNDGVTADSTLFSDNNIHPNKNGNLKMYNQFLTDAGFIFG